MAATHRVIISNQAIADLQHIFTYIQQDSSQNAATVINRLLEAIDKLDEFPSRYGIVGRSRKRGTAIHRMSVRPFLVYYSVDDARGVVVVLVVRHGARRQPVRFP
jgi:addiction module RelE/StbE family toxin